MDYMDSLNSMESMTTAEMEELLMNNPELLAALGIFFIAMFAVMFVAWLITLYPRYYMVKTSGVGPAWSAFIPIWQDIQFFKMGGFKWWHYWVYIGVYTVASFIPILSYIVPFASIAFMCVLYWKVSGSFGLGTAGKILSLFLGWWVYWYVALTKKPYQPAWAQTYYPQQNQNWYQDNQQAQNQNWYQTPPQQQPPQQDQNWYQK